MTEESPLIGSRAFKIVPLAGFSGGRLQTRIPGAETLIYLIRKNSLEIWGLSKVKWFESRGTFLESRATCPTIRVIYFQRFIDSHEIPLHSS